jgi:DNA-binding LytR/AlgR family response regulator
MKIYQQKGNSEFLILNHKTSTKVFVKSVILIKADINYTKFYLVGGKVRTVAHSIKFFENHLETHGFLRVHRAFIINPDFVKTYNSEQESLTMSNGQIANISRRRKGILKGLVA